MHTANSFVWLTPIRVFVSIHLRTSLQYDVRQIKALREVALVGTQSCAEPFILYPQGLLGNC